MIVNANHVKNIRELKDKEQNLMVLMDAKRNSSNEDRRMRSSDGSQKRNRDVERRESSSSDSSG